MNPLTTPPLPPLDAEAEEAEAEESTPDCHCGALGSYDSEVCVGVYCGTVFLCTPNKLNCDSPAVWTCAADADAEAARRRVVPNGAAEATDRTNATRVVCARNIRGVELVNTSSICGAQLQYALHFRCTHQLQPTALTVCDRAKQTTTEENRNKVDTERKEERETRM